MHSPGPAGIPSQNELTREGVGEYGASVLAGSFPISINSPLLALDMRSSGGKTYIFLLSKNLLVDNRDRRELQ